MCTCKYMYIHVYVYMYVVYKYVCISVVLVTITNTITSFSKVLFFKNSHTMTITKSGHYCHTKTTPVHNT